MTEISVEDRELHWQRTHRLMITHLVIWFIFAFVVHWFASSTNSINFFGWPLNYYMAAQGSLAVFVIQIFLFGKQQHAIDRKFGVDEEDGGIE